MSINYINILKVLTYLSKIHGNCELNSNESEAEIEISKKVFYICKN